MVDIPVTEFLAFLLPGILADDAPFPKRPSSWFSADLPNCGDDTVWALESIPPLDLVRQLETAFSQAWLNGAQSIVDHTNSTRRLPLCTLTLFREIITLRDGQDRWRESYNWLPDTEKYLLDFVAWNSKHAGAPDGQLDWTRLISDEWLSGGIIDGMIRDIKARVSENPTLESSSVSGKHESFHEAETVDGLSYLVPGRNLFQHVAPSDGPFRPELALFTHAPISELVYLLTGAALKTHSDGTFSLSGGDSGWERWQILTAREMQVTVQLEGAPTLEFGDAELSEDDEDYEEGASKKQRKIPQPRAGGRKGSGKSKTLSFSLCDLSIAKRNHHNVTLKISLHPNCSTSRTPGKQRPSSSTFTALSFDGMIVVTGKEVTHGGAYTGKIGSMPNE
ncbi:hypothetical protein B0H11DRAFT_2347378 [Mycena galericulata]|nr:hypothetical protein B0H11DRAFT_2347378 [Mycena galericulata]